MSSESNAGPTVGQVRNQLYRSEDGRAQVHADYRSVLGAWPVPHEEIQVPTCQGETFVVACGPADAPAVVLLHGGAANSAMWIRNVQTWARVFRVHAVDIIGEPGFSAPSRPALSSDAYARWMDDVLAGLRLPRASFVGASFGGLLALDYAIRRPASVRALVLLAPAGIANLRAGYLLSAVPVYFMGAWGRRKALELVMGLPPEERTPAAERFLKSCELIMNHHLIRTQPLPVFRDKALRNLKMPLLVVVGAKDIVFNSNTIRRRLRTCVDGARLIWLETAGHGLTDQTAAIGEFLSSAVRSSPPGT
jgi:pimeloyl-ACP methyl ester carboxylesterase